LQPPLIKSPESRLFGLISALYVRVCAPNQYVCYLPFGVRAARLGLLAKKPLQMRMMGIKRCVLFYLLLGERV
jgi:hypothetical protein